MKVKTEYTGCTVTKQYLTVHFRLEVGGSLVRSASVKIPVEDTTKAVFQTAFDNGVRRALIELWGQDQELAPWDED